MGIRARVGEASLDTKSSLAVTSSLLGKIKIIKKKLFLKYLNFKVSFMQAKLL